MTIRHTQHLVCNGCGWDGPVFPAKTPKSLIRRTMKRTLKQVGLKKQRKTP